MKISPFITIIFSLVTPLIIWFYSPEMILNSVGSCRASDIYIEKNDHETIIRENDWVVTKKNHILLGHYTGKIKVYDDNHNLTLHKYINRTFTSYSEVIGSQLRSTTKDSSEIFNDGLTPEQQKKYLLPMFSIGKINLTSFFKADGKVYLYGLPDRPRGICLE